MWAEATAQHTRVQECPCQPRAAQRSHGSCLRSQEFRSREASRQDSGLCDLSTLKAEVIPGRADRGPARSFHNPFQSGSVEHTNAAFSRCKTPTKKVGRGGQGGLGESPELAGISRLLLGGFSRTSLVLSCEGEHNSQLPSPAGPTQLGSPLLQLQSAISGVPHFPDGPGTRGCSLEAEAYCGPGTAKAVQQRRSCEAQKRGNKTNCGIRDFFFFLRVSAPLLRTD